MYRLSYYPWLTQNVPAQEIDNQIRAFAGAVSVELAKLGAAVQQVDVLPPLDVPAQMDQIVNGGAEIALMNPLGFAFARRRSGQVEALAVAERILHGKVGVVYYAQLYARADKNIANLKATAGRSIGYGTPYSTSNFLMPAQLLKQAGVHPWLGFLRSEFLQGHDKVAVAVYQGLVDVGAGHDGVIVDLANQPGFSDAQTVLKQIAHTLPIPSDPVVVNIPDPAQRALLQQALVAASASPTGAAALKIFWGNTQGLQPTTSDPYAVLLAAMDDLKLAETDVLPPPPLG